MRVSSASPFRVASILWQPRPGASALTVVCKATFTLQPGESSPSLTQEAVCAADVAWDDGRGSLRAASDLAPFKRRADVVVVGHAHAPQGKPVSSLVARIAVGEVDKAVEVHGDRRWTPDGHLTAAAPFTRMPLRWERASGGPGTWNPVGVRVGAAAAAQGRPAPNLVPVGSALRSPDEAIRPAGFGPLAPAWPERVAKLRRYAASWRHEAWAEQPLPEDIDAAYFNAAPPDQQLDQLRGSERIVLEHLHPDHPHLVTTLEVVLPQAVVHRNGEAAQEVRLRCDTLVIDADRGLCTLTWRGVVPLRQPSDDGVVFVTAERAATDADATITLVPAARPSPQKPTLPFVTRPASPLVPPAADAPAAPDAGAQRPTPPPTASDEPAAPTATPASASEPEADTLPGRLLPVGVNNGATTLSAPLAPAGAASLPFRQAQTVDAARPPLDAREAVPPHPTPPPPPLVGAVVTPPREEDEPREPMTERRPSEPAPPVPSPVATPEPLAIPRNLAAAPSSPPPPSPELPPERAEDISVERFAEISAELAEGRSPRLEVLRAHGLGDRAWAAAELRWQTALVKDGARGGRLRATYDSVYVASVERFRGPISLPEYARIAVALERGQANEALDALKIQRAALMPIVRVWTKRVAGDPKLASQTMAHLAALRAE